MPSILTPRLRDQCRAGGGKMLRKSKVVDDSKRTVSSRHTSTETVTAHTRHAQLQTRQNLSTERGKWTQSPGLNQQAVCNWCYWEISSLQRSVTGYIALGTLLPRCHWLTQDRLHSFCVLSVFFF